jgi:hypothetical protein
MNNLLENQNHQNHLLDICHRICKYKKCTSGYCDSMMTFPIYTQAFLLHQELLKLKNSYPELQKNLAYLKKIQNEDQQNDENFWNDNLSHIINNIYKFNTNKYKMLHKSRKPRRSGSRRSGPRRSGPKRSGPRRSGPRRSGPRRSGPRRSGPRRSGPRRSGPKRSGSKRSGSRRSGSRRSGPKRSGPRRSGPRRSGPRRSGQRHKSHGRK